MFIVYAIPIGLLLGRLLGGRLDGLSGLRFRFVWLAVAGLVVQVLLFNGPLGAVGDDLVPILYVGSTAAVFVALVANLRIPGIALMTIGAAANLAAIVANGGFMPSDPRAAEEAGLGAIAGVSNSIEIPDPALRILTDIFAVPAWVPLANVFSVGDVLIGAGVVGVIVAAMRRRAPAADAPTPDAGQPPD